MAKLKLGAIADEKPVRITVELSASTHRDITAYAEVLARETGQSIAEPAKLVGPMLARFMAADRAFAKARRAQSVSGRKP
ncbi:DUF2274 domain-containing protein [Rhodopseudomonas palustris]|uniref:DUF2274 domain-containing protein n=1 Tax=Rhodopseudomonas palustris (strain BisB18) TaxID=316056 RepID=Q20ZL9_RHOPB